MGCRASSRVRIPPFPPTLINQGLSSDLTKSLLILDASKCLQIPIKTHSPVGFWWVFCFGDFLMQLEDHLKLLQSQYPGRVVLYADDIATILGKTKRSLDGLIARDGLPFRIKKLNGRWCTGILDVASWLSADNEAEIPPASTSAPARKRKVPPVAPSSPPRGRVSFAAELRKMRLARSFQTICNKLSLLDSDDEREFVAEMFQSALPAAILMPDSFVETDHWSFEVIEIHSHSVAPDFALSVRQLAYGDLK